MHEHIDRLEVIIEPSATLCENPVTDVSSRDLKSELFPDSLYKTCVLKRSVSK